VGGISSTKEDILIQYDLIDFLTKKYLNEKITNTEIKLIFKKLISNSSSDLYESNKSILNLISNGFLLKREDRTKKDLYIQLIDYEDIENNSFKFVTQMEIQGNELRIP